VLPCGRNVILRRERRSGESRLLEPSLDEAGNLHIDGQDIGGAANLVSSDGSTSTTRRSHPRTCRVCGRCSTSMPTKTSSMPSSSAGRGQSYELERRLSESKFPLRRTTW
jgi:hypothetical protein